MRPEHRESIMKKAHIRARILTTAVKWFKAGCPEARADGRGEHCDLQDAIHEYIDHENQVQERALTNKIRHNIRKYGDGTA